MREIFETLVTTYSDKIFTILFTIIGTLLVTAAVEMLFKSWQNHAPNKRAKTFLGVILHVIRVGIIIMAFLFVLSVLNVNTTPFLASAGILGLAIGFGSQLLIRDIITGVFLIMENQFNTGDKVKIDQIEGFVEHISLRTIAVRDINGALHIIPNGQINKLANLSKNFSRAVIDIKIPIGNDVDAVLKVLNDTLGELDASSEIYDNVLKPGKILALEDIADGKMGFKILIKTKPEKQEEIARLYRYHLKKNLDKAKISLT